MEQRDGTSPRASQLLLFVTLLGFLGALPALQSSDLHWCYPYMTPDSWDWLVNGLSWSGAPVPASYRPPGLPLVVAALHRLQALPLLPYLNHGVFALSALLLHRLLRLRHSPTVAAFAVLLFVSNGSFFGYVRFVMAEVWTLPFLIGAAIALARARLEPRHLLTAAALLGASFLFHYAGAIVGLGYAVALVAWRRPWLATRWPWLALLVAAPVPTAWWLLRRQHDATTATVHVIEGLVRPSFEHLGYYLGVGLALVGILALPLYLVGLSGLLRPREACEDDWAMAVVAPLTALALFFTFVYDWADKRFLYYLLPFAIAVGGEGASRLLAWGGRGGLRRVAALSLLAVAALWNRIPYPAATHSLLALAPGVFWKLGETSVDSGFVARFGKSETHPLLSDGFYSYRLSAPACMNPRAAAEASRLRDYLDARLDTEEAVAYAGSGSDSTTYWIETNQLIFALERPVVKPGASRYVVRRLDRPDARATATFGPFEIFDLESIAKLPPELEPAPARAGRQRKRRHS